MNHFELRGGELACEGVPLERASPRRSARRSMSIPSATLERHFTVFRDALDGARGLGAAADRLRREGQLQRRRCCGRWRGWARAPTPSPKARSAARWRPASRPSGSSSPASARPPASSPSRSKPASPRSTSSPSPSSTCVAQRRGREGRARRRSPSASIRTSAPAATPRSPPARPRSSSASRSARPSGSTPRPPTAPALRPVGVACHIGSQITDLAPLRGAFAQDARPGRAPARPRGSSVERLDLGGGLGVPYFNQPDPPTPGRLRRDGRRGACGGLDVQLAFEPGRVIAANAGVLLARVIHVHAAAGGPAVPGAGRGDERPDPAGDVRGLSRHPPGAGRGRAPPAPTTWSGPICETGDTFARERLLPPLEAGDLVAFMSAGAYGAAMSSEYNTRPLVPEVLVKGADSRWSAPGRPTTRCWPASERRTGCPDTPRRVASPPPRCTAGRAGGLRRPCRSRPGSGAARPRRRSRARWRAASATACGRRRR